MRGNCSPLSKSRMRRAPIWLLSVTRPGEPTATSPISAASAPSLRARIVLRARSTSEAVTNATNGLRLQHKWIQAQCLAGALDFFADRHSILIDIDLYPRALSDDGRAGFVSSIRFANLSFSFDHKRGPPIAPHRFWQTQPIDCSGPMSRDVRFWHK